MHSSWMLEARVTGSALSGGVNFWGSAEVGGSVSPGAAAVWSSCSERRAARCLYSSCCMRIQAGVAGQRVAQWQESVGVCVCVSPPPVSSGGNPELPGSGRGNPLRCTSGVSGSGWCGNWHP